MDLLGLFKSLLSKDTFYIAVFALTVGLSSGYFNWTDVPWLLIFLYTFIGVSLIRWLFYKIKDWVARYNRSRKEKTAEKQRFKERENLIDRHLIGMSIEAKYAALKVIEEIKPMKDNHLEFVIRNPYEYQQVCGRSDYYNNPYKIDVPLGCFFIIEVNRQREYCTVIFNEKFYNYLKDNAESINIEMNEKYPPATYRYI
jgi:hypothetical protein